MEIGPHYLKNLMSSNVYPYVNGTKIIHSHIIQVDNFNLYIVYCNEYAEPNTGSREYKYKK